MDLSGYQALVWSLTGVLLAFFTAFAMIYAFIRRRRLAASVTFNQEEFITARRQVGALRIGWSFFAGALGAWVISSPPSYTASGYGYGAGAIGLVFYSLASGLPVIMIAFAGDLIRRKVPHVLSLTDFMGWRYGYAAKTYVVLLCVFNMSIATLAEYTTIGTLFGVYLGSKAVAITVTVGLLTMAYTAYGGLYISIITDQVQGIAVTLFFSICVIFMAVDFRSPLPKPFPQDCCVANESCFPDPTLSPDDQAAIMASCNCLENMMGFCLSGKNKVGYSSIFVMPASLFTATVFSEAMWQRAWASTDKRSLVRGSIVGCVGIVVVVFFVGLCGILAAWGGRITDATDYNLYFLAALGAVDANNNISGWIGVVVMLLAVAMNMSAIDSLQNGIAGAVSSHLLKGKPVMWTRLAVLIISIPLMVLGTQPGGLDLKVLELFLIANMICCTSATPVLLGLSDKLHRYLGGASMLFSCINAILMTSVYGVDYYYKNFEAISYANALAGKYQTKTIGNGMNFTWMGNGYLWQFFLVPIGVSTASMLLCAGLNVVIHRVSGQPAVAGFIAPATHPALFPVAVADLSEGSEDGPAAKGGQEQFIGKRGSDSDEFTHPPAQPAVA